MVDKCDSGVETRLNELLGKQVSPLDLLPHDDLREKFIDLVVNGEPDHHDKEMTRLFSALERELANKPTENVKVVVFGGGTGLSNIIGGDCRLEGWIRSPFSGLKEVFPQTRAVVCVTDDGGSTGELLKDLPLVAIGDIRHVLLSSIQLSALQRTYQVTVSGAIQIAGELAKIFNYRFTEKPVDANTLIEQTGAEFTVLPFGLQEFCRELIDRLFHDHRLVSTLSRPQCLGNLMICAAIYKFIPAELENRELCEEPSHCHDPTFKGMQYLALSLGATQRAVLPCTTTPSQLRLVYANGVQTTGESKSSVLRRGVPVESAHVDFYGDANVHEEIFRDIADADILILAPGSLYSSIIPVFKVPGLADAVRSNTSALKLLISNLWVQAGETDLSMTDPERKFHVSDMIKAYERNIPGGVSGLFSEVLCLSLKDVPASVIQSYAVEGKVPIYLDRDVVAGQGFIPVECGIYSKQALAERGVIQHDPAMVATAVKVLYCGAGCFDDNNAEAEVKVAGETAVADSLRPMATSPSMKYMMIRSKVAEWSVNCTEDCQCSCFTGEDDIRQNLVEILYRHHDIPVAHLDYTAGVRCIGLDNWKRDQQWDNVYSFYDPADKVIKIRNDQFAHPKKLEAALLISLGESLLGDYALEKRMADLYQEDLFLGKVYHLEVKNQDNRFCYFNDTELSQYLSLARMCQGNSAYHYTRVINGREGFTPPGLLLGLIYAWYLDNGLASHIEYKMSVMRLPQSDLIPEQKKIVRRREKMISFFREVIFRA